jgi:hypothetical protein
VGGVRLGRHGKLTCRQAGRPAGPRRQISWCCRANPTRHARAYVACGHRPPPVARALLRAGPAGFRCRISGQMMERECDLLAATPAVPGARGRGAHAGASGRGGAADKTCPAYAPATWRAAHPDPAWPARRRRHAPSLDSGTKALAVRCVRLHLKFGQLASATTPNGCWPARPLRRPAGPGRPVTDRRRRRRRRFKQVGRSRISAWLPCLSVSTCARGRRGVVEKDHIVQALFWDTTAVPVRVCNEELYKNASQKGIIMCRQITKFGGSERDGGL